MKKKPKVFAVYVSDSHYRALLNLVSGFSSKGYEVVWVKIASKWETEVPVFDFGIIITAVGGRLLNKIRQKNNNVFIVACYPGIVSRRRVEDFFTKMTADVVLLNSKSDYVLFCKLNQAFQRETKAILFGAPWVSVLNSSHTQSATDGYILFSEQVNIPYSRNEKVKLLLGLAQLARIHKSKVIINLRDKQEHLSSNQLWILASEYKLLNEIKFSQDDIHSMLRKAKFVVSISSSVILDALVNNIPAFALNDFYSKKYYSDFFTDKTISVSMSDLAKMRQPSIDVKNHWYINNVSSSTANLETNLNKIIDEFVGFQSSSPPIFNVRCFFRVVVALGIYNSFRVGFVNLYRQFKNSQRIIW